MRNVCLPFVLRSATPQPEFKRILKIYILVVIKQLFVPQLFVLYWQCFVFVLIVIVVVVVFSCLFYSIFENSLFSILLLYCLACAFQRSLFCYVLFCVVFCRFFYASTLQIFMLSSSLLYIILPGLFEDKKYI